MELQTPYYGYTCMDNDYLFIITNKKKLSVRNKIIYNIIEAYTMCLAP